MSQRHLHLDGLRGLAALFVVMDHPLVAFDMAFLTGRPEDARTSWDAALSGAPFFLPLSGSLSVNIFFLLSGYVLAQAFYRAQLGLAAQLAKRYVRLALPILIACLISYALLSAGWMHNHELAGWTQSGWLDGQFQQTPSLLAALREGGFGALMLGVQGGTSYDSSLWTMPIEFYGSLGLILIFQLARLLPNNAATRLRGLQLGLLGLAVLFYSSALGLFALGALLAMWGGLPKLDRRVVVPVFVLGLFLGTFPTGPSRWEGYDFLLRLTPPLPSFMPFGHSLASFWNAAGALLILLSAENWVPFRRMLLSRPLQFLGHVSFPLYLIHIPLLMSVISVAALWMLGTGLAYWLVACLSVALLIVVSLLVAAGLFYISERPAIALAVRVGQWVQAGRREM